MFRKVTMSWNTLLLSIVLAAPRPVMAAADARGSSVAKTSSIEALVERLLRGGFPDKLPGLLAQLVELPSEPSYRGVLVTAEQSTDAMPHKAMVIVDESSQKPTFLVFQVDRRTQGHKEGYWFRASVEGALQKATLLDAKMDENGKGIKGTGVTTPQDIESPETQKRFQHELDLWLKKSHLKKQWRNAEFSGGVLTKKASRR